MVSWAETMTVQRDWGGQGVWGSDGGMEDMVVWMVDWGGCR